MCGSFVKKSPQAIYTCGDVEGYYEKDAAVLDPRKRLIVSQSRRERVYKRTGDANVRPFAEKEEQRNEHALAFEKKSELAICSLLRCGVGGQFGCILKSARAGADCGDV